MGPDETMIKSLRVRNLATIEDLELRMESGFSILTGETGAGKSIIIDAIRLVLGEKASPDLVRTGKKEAGIEAVFDVEGPPEGTEDLPPAEDGELLVQRQISEQGTGKAYVNGVLVPVRRLKDLGPRLVDIYGQNDHVFLLHLENHLRYLDAFLDDPELLRDTARRAQELRRLVQEKKDLETRERERDERLDFLAFQVREIEAARLKPGEDADLLREREILRNSEKIAGLVDRALDIAYVHEDSLVPLLARLQAVLAELARFDDSLRNLQSGLQESSVVLKDVADSLARFKERRSESAGNLEAIEERLSAIEKVKRKHGGTVEAVLERLEILRREQAALSSSRERLSGIEAEIRAKFRAYSELARKLGALRRKEAKKLEGLIEKEISLLGMKKARFSVRVVSVEPSMEDAATIRDQGGEDVEFLISPNPGEELRPLRRIASGGELSRIMLALKSVGKETESRKTLIFDEIDSGIGGKTAEFIAQKLRQLAARHQVICITHLPQIASTALHHFRVEKKIERERTFTLAKRLGRDERVTEIARLISGSRLTDASLEIAREMLDHNLGGERMRP
jgi:DNA repair protein RecN (Recombination protein N)